MNYPLPVFEEWVPCAPMFAPDGDGFVLTDAAHALLDSPEPLHPAPLSVLERIAAVRVELACLAAALPAAARVMAPPDLLDALEALQEAANALGSLDQTVVAEVDRSEAFVRWGFTSTANLLLHRLRVRPAEAKRRVVTARSCTERRTLPGEVLPAVRPAVAAAQAAGLLNVDHAAVIIRGLDRLPIAVPVEQVDALEQALVDCAHRADPSTVAKAVRRMLDTFDPDGPEPRDDQQRKNRGISLSQADSGAGVLRGDLTAGLLAKLQTVLSPLAAPRPDDVNGPDTRTPSQRMHDALEDLCDRFLRSGTLPDSGGVPATVCLSITIRDLETRTGRVHTSHGGDMSVAEILKVAADAEIIPIVVNDAGGILSYGRSKRFATPGQTRALHARDKGCVFPGCSRPPQWCQRHHVEEWVRDRGPTDIAKLALLCGYHHHNFEAWGWRIFMQDGMPWWTPPADLDPEQKPIQNQAHLAVF